MLDTDCFPSGKQSGLSMSDRGAICRPGVHSPSASVLPGGQLGLLAGGAGLAAAGAAEGGAAEGEGLIAACGGCSGCVGGGGEGLIAACAGCSVFGGVAAGGAALPHRVA
jgi:hypothetical protein